MEVVTGFVIGLNCNLLGPHAPLCYTFLGSLVMKFQSLGFIDLLTSHSRDTEQLASITVQFELGAWELVRRQYVVST